MNPEPSEDILKFRDILIHGYGLKVTAEKNYSIILSLIIMLLTKKEEIRYSLTLAFVTGFQINSMYTGASTQASAITKPDLQEKRHRYFHRKKTKKYLRKCSDF
jgi:hypothetical protein